MELKEKEIIQEFFVVLHCEEKKAVNGPYLNLQLQNKEIIVIGNYWKCPTEMMGLIKRGDIIKIKAVVDFFKGNFQLNINKLRLKNNEDNILMEDLIKAAPIEPKIMLDEIYKLIATFKNAELENISTYILDKYKVKLIYYPGAKTMHHAFRSGLLYHILTMLKVAKSILPIYPFLNDELLFTGIILHDILKTEEMISDELGVDKYSIKGELLGHITMCVSLLDRLKDELNISEETIMILEHLVLSHHHKAEFGSPKPPMIPEGEMLHFIDNIDAKMNIFEDIYRELKPGEIKYREFRLDRRNVYKPNWGKDE